jgi:Spx/MgsR family transcriptional regulator
MSRIVTLYGIPNCDQVKKARAWLAAKGVDHVFHDFKKQGLAEPLAQAWLDSLGADILINRKGSTWRSLDPARQRLADAPAGALALMTEQPSLVKRPVLDAGGTLHVGFTPESYARLF